MVQGIAGNRAEQLASFDARRALATTPRVSTSRGDAPSNPALQQAQANVADTTAALRGSSHGIRPDTQSLAAIIANLQADATANPQGTFNQQFTPPVPPQVPGLGQFNLDATPNIGPFRSAPRTTQFGLDQPVSPQSGVLDMVSGLEQLLPQISLDTPEGIQIAAFLQQLISLIGQSSLLQGNGISTGITSLGGS